MSGALKRSGPIRRTARLTRSVAALPKVNRDRQKRRRRGYQKALHSAHWRQLKAQVFAEQRGLCVCGQEAMTVLDHLTYARLGKELRDDVRGLGDICNARETLAHRVNWRHDRRRDLSHQ